MKNSLIEENLGKFKEIKRLSPVKGFSYNKDKGYWENSKNKEPLVRYLLEEINTRNNNDDRIDRPMTKKEDIETGEDQKGE